MGKSILEEIFWYMYEEQEYINSPSKRKLEELTDEKRSIIESLVSRDLYMQIEEDISTIQLHSEYSGFMLGFKCAVKLFEECGFWRNRKTDM